MIPADEEEHQVIREVFQVDETEAFYAAALATLTRAPRPPRRGMRTASRIANGIIYGLWLITGAFVAEQLWDRSQAPFEFASAIAKPYAIVAGEPVRVVVEIMRHQRCTYAITWTVTDAAHMVVGYGPIEQRAPGPPGRDTYAHAYETPSVMALGPATLRVTLRGECDGNFVDNWWPRTIDMPPVAFEVVPPTKP